MMKLLSGLLLAVTTLLGSGALLGVQDSKPAAGEGLAYEGSTITSVKVKDLKTARAWYEKILGAKLYFELAEAGWCEMTTPVKNALIGLSQVAPGETFESNGGSALSFGVTDMQKSKEWLTKNKVTLKGDVIEIPQTVKLLYFQDPDGNTLMLYEPYQGK
jgi:catechol 2,3-dioxygenase-like lactoylglutathione lyase family enzyme